MNAKFQRNKTNRTPRFDGMQVRIEMLKRGVSPHSWAQQYGFDSSTVWRTLRRGGPARKASREITQRLISDFGL